MNLGKFTFYFLTGGVFLATLLVIASIFMMPVAVKWYANNWFASQGLDSDIKSVDFDLTNGLFILDGLAVKDSEGTHLKIDHLMVQIKLLDLLARKILIEKIMLSGLYLDVVKKKGDVTKYAGIRSQKTDKALPVKSNSDTNAPWEILLKEFDLHNVEACYQAAAIENRHAYHDCAKLNELEWRGRSSFTLYNDPVMRSDGLIISSSIRLSGFALDDRRLKRNLMRFDEMDIKQLKTVGINDIQLRGITIDAYQALQEKTVDEGVGEQPYLFALGGLSIDNMVASKLSNISIDSMRLDGMQAKLSREADKSLNIQNTIKQYFDMKKSKDAGSSTAPDKSVPFSLSLKHFQIDGKSEIDIRDASVMPPFSDRLSKINIKLDGVDTADKSKVSQLKFGFMVGDHGKVQANGRVQLLAKRPTIKVKAEFEGIDVANFTTYANDLLQQQVKSGLLDADLDVSIKQGDIDAKSKIVLHKFYVEALGEGQTNQYQDKIGMPLNTALSLLREKNDRITLKIPVTGDVENPEFSFNDIFRKVTADAIKSAIINYYTPFGLVKLLAAGYKLATALRFDPVVFDPAQSDLSTADKQQLDKLADLLNKRPGIRLVICGQAVRKDFESLYPFQAKKLESAEREKRAEQSTASDMITSEVPAAISVKQKNKLIDLATLRGKIIQQYLIDQYKVDPNRLILCNPTFSYADTGDARAEISI